MLTWKAPKQGTGTIVIKATVAGPGAAEGGGGGEHGGLAPRFQLSYTLTEVSVGRHTTSLAVRSARPPTPMESPHASRW